MSWLGEAVRRVRFLLRRDGSTDELAEEMRLHLQLRAEEHVAAGLSPTDAERQARRGFGNVTRLAELGRDEWAWTFFEDLLKDVRYGLRSIAADPRFAVIAIGSLALGIGANTAIFSVLNAVMLQSLPVDDPQRLVQLSFTEGPNFRGVYTNPIWEQVRDRQQVFSGVLATGGGRFDLSKGGESQFADGILVSGDFFRVLGVPALRGRLITPRDDLHGCGSDGPVAVISYAFWKSHFSGYERVIGRTLTVERHAFQVVGVTPSWFTGLDRDRVFDFAIPIGCDPLLHPERNALEARSTWWLQILGRLKDGQTQQQAQAQLNLIAPELFRATLPPNWSSDMQKRYLREKFSVSPAATGFSGTRLRYRTGLYALMGVVALVLLIACANVANLLLARGAVRKREISVRLAVGASRPRIVRQLLTESALLAIASAVGGFFFALLGSRLVLRMLSTTNNEVQLDMTPDMNLLLFTTGVAAATVILFGLVPALRTSSVNPNQSLKENSRGTVSGTSRANPAKILVITQIALSLVLLVGAALFVATLRNLLTTDLGFKTQGVLLIDTAIPPSNLRASQRGPLFSRVLDRLRAIPGVTSASSSFGTPIQNRFWNEYIYPEGYTAKSETDLLVYFNRVSTDYFRTVQTKLLVGRDFSAHDKAESPKVIIISESAARQFFGSIGAVGKTINMDAPRLRHGNKQDRFVVIGVVNDIKYTTIDEQPQKTAYLPSTQDLETGTEMQFQVRSEIPMSALNPVVRAAIAEVGPEISLSFHAFGTQISDSLLQPRLVALLSSCFGMLALVLAVVGLYGLIEYAVTRRRGEIGIRLALGAQRNSVVWLVLKDVIILMVVGIAIGTVASTMLGRLVTTLLYGVQPGNPLGLIVSISLLAAAGIGAGYTPARQASRLDPMTTLREE